MRPELIARRTILSCLLALAGAAAGCSEAVTCGAGTIAQGGSCVVAPSPTCGAGTYADGGTCVPVPTAPPVTCNPACGAGEICDPSAICVAAPEPEAWTCESGRYRDGTICDCACGAPDPDCTIASAPVVGCRSNACQADGTCATCTPSCAGKACGDDGCGGSCGGCFDPQKLFCLDGACAGCTPQCQDKACGPDGCGGTCGTCGPGLVCTLGRCDVPPPEASCANRCLGVAPSGCSCQSGCDRVGTCCVDVADCGCLPSCNDRACGDDGCGGSCGSCGDDELCVIGECRTNVCQPDPCSGNGTCHYPDASCTCRTGFTGEHCAACAEGYAGYPDCRPDLCGGNTCSGHGTCTPATGYCQCSGGFTGLSCNACLPGHGTYPSCTR